MAQLAPSKKKESFTYIDPCAENVAVVGDFTVWEQHPIALRKQKNGDWKATVSLDPGLHEYRFLVDGQWRDDAACAQRTPNAFGAENCVREVR